MSKDQPPTLDEVLSALKRLRTAEKTLAAHPSNDVTSRWERKLYEVEYAQDAADTILARAGIDIEIDEEEI